jgi:hypothetical protein
MCSKMRQFEGIADLSPDSTVNSGRMRLDIRERAGAPVAGNIV